MSDALSRQGRQRAKPTDAVLSSRTGLDLSNAPSHR